MLSPDYWLLTKGCEADPSTEKYWRRQVTIAIAHGAMTIYKYVTNRYSNVYKDQYAGLLGIQM